MRTIRILMALAATAFLLNGCLVVALLTETSSAEGTFAESEPLIQDVRTEPPPSREPLAAFLSGKTPLLHHGECRFQFNGRYVRAYCTAYEDDAGKRYRMFHIVYGDRKIPLFAKDENGIVVWENPDPMQGMQRNA
jgi:hypothetical protein